MVQIASGDTFRTDPAAWVVGPTGLAYDCAKDILNVASTGDNAIFAIEHAGSTSSDQGMGNLIDEDPAHQRGPLGLALDPDDDLFAPKGRFVGRLSLDPVQGAAFGLAFTLAGDDLIVATVNTDTNTVDERFVP